jgi:hypothetical protein
MQRSQKFLVIKILLCLIPMNIFIIGRDYIGAGIQFPFFRFQVSYLGNSFIIIIQEISYVFNGIIFGVSIFSLLLWIFGSLLLLISILIPLVKSRFIRNGHQNSGILIFLTGILFLISIVIQYGPYFHGSAGTAIPIGLPVLFFIGGWIYTEGQKEVSGNEDQDMQEIGEGSV